MELLTQWKKSFKFTGNETKSTTTIILMMFVLIHSICGEDSADQSQSADPQVQRERQVGAKQLFKPVFYIIIKVRKKY